MTVDGLSVGSICTGYGGLELALQLAGVAHTLVWVSEIDPHASTVLTERFSGVPNIGDINDITPPVVDLVCAGFPCQDISVAGKHAGIYGPRSGLWWRIRDVISDLQPRHVLLENVAALTTRGGTHVIGSLTELGYDSRWTTLRACDIGAPHRRNRWFCIAWNTNSPRPQRPRPPRPTPHPNRSTAHNPNKLARQSPLTLRDSHNQQLQRHRSRTRPRHHPPNGKRPYFGDYQPAITRWEHHLNRPAPPPTTDTHRLNPVFVEWMMGLPPGWVTNCDIPRTAALRILGNGVVPQQGAHALHLLTNHPTAADQEAA